MTEKERIITNNNGELPIGEYDIVIVRGITNPQAELHTFKETILAFLENKNLNDESPAWENLLPKQLVAFTNQLEEEDYHKDDLITHICPMIYDLQNIREWEWYSSKLGNTSFEVIMKGMFRYIFRPILHHQGIPHANIFVVRNGKEYPTKSIIDVLTYKTFDPISFKLTHK